MARLKRILRHPAAAVVLLVMLGLSVWSLPSGIYDWTVVGMVRAGRVDWSTGRLDIHRMGGITAYIVREPAADGPTTLRLIDPRTESWSELAALTTRRPGDLVEFTIRAGEYKTGFYAPSRFVKFHEVETKELGNPSSFTADELARARAMFVDWSSLLGRAHDRYARERDYQAITPLWTGRAHNLLALLALTGLVYSVWWNLLPSTRRARNRAKRLSRGLCPRCRYPLHGLAENQCPECGEEWGSAEQQAARA